MTLTRLTKLIAVFGGLFSAIVTLIVGDHSNVLLILLGFAFAAWTAAPFALIYNRAASYTPYPIAAGLILLISAITCAASIFVYWTTFIDNSNPDAQDGIILLILPLYQLVAIGVVLAISSFIIKFSK